MLCSLHAGLLEAEPFCYEAWDKPAAEIVAAVEVGSTPLGHGERDEHVWLQGRQQLGGPTLDIPPRRNVNRAEWQSGCAQSSNHLIEGSAHLTGEGEAEDSVDNNVVACILLGVGVGGVRKRTEGVERRCAEVERRRGGA